MGTKKKIEKKHPQFFVVAADPFETDYFDTCYVNRQQAENMAVQFSEEDRDSYYVLQAISRTRVSEIAVEKLDSETK